MVQAHNPEQAAAARRLVTSVAASPASAAVVGSLVDLMGAVRRGPADPAASAPLLMRLASGGSTRACDLAQALHLDQSTVSRHVATLESDGLVRRIPDSADRRAHLLELTPDGDAAAREQITTRVRQFEAATDGWTADDMTTFASLLDRFVQGLAANERKHA